MVLALNTAVLLLTLISPFVAFYAISFIKKGDLAKHAKIHKILFVSCMIALVFLEMQIRLSGGSGSIVKHSEYYNTSFFKNVLFYHIIGAVLTYLIWAITIIATSLAFKKNNRLNSRFSKTHRFLGKVTFFGLIYTAVTALAVYLMTFIL